MKTSAILAAAFLATASAASANADVFFDLTNNFNGQAPSGSPSWMTATFADTATAGEVKLTLKTTLQDADEFIRTFWFNVSDAHEGNISIKAGSKVDIIGTVSPGALTTPGQTPGNWDFDYELAFPTANNAGRFNAVEEFSLILISSDLGDVLDESDFNDQDGIKNEESVKLFVAAKVQGIPIGEGSGEIGDGDGSGGNIPEPASLSLLGLGAAGLLLRRRKA